MRVLFILPYPIEGPSSRFRVYQFLPYLEARGISCTVRPFLPSSLIGHLYSEGALARKVMSTARGLYGRLEDTLDARRHDLVFVLREAFALGPPLLESLLAKRAGRLVFDFDDAIYTGSLAYDNPIDRLRDFGKPAKLIAMADRVIAGSPHLARYAERFADPGRICVLPTVVDPMVYQPGPAREHGTITIGWIGTPRGSGYLRDLLPVFSSVAQERPQVRFVFVGAEPFEPGPVPIRFKRWALAEEVSDLQNFDIGIMPLTDDEETRGKCGFKLIQYMSVGVAPVCSPVGANRGIVEDGVTGLFAENSADWRTHLLRLVDDLELRRRFGAAGRARVIAEFSLASVAPRLLRVLEEAGGR